MRVTWYREAMLTEPDERFGQGNLSPLATRLIAGVARSVSACLDCNRYRAQKNPRQSPDDPTTNGQSMAVHCPQIRVGLAEKCLIVSNCPCPVVRPPSSEVGIKAIYQLERMRLPEGIAQI